MAQIESNAPDAMEKTGSPFRWWLLWILGFVLGQSLGVLMLGLLMAVSIPTPLIPFPYHAIPGSNWPVPLNWPLFGLTIGLTQTIILHYYGVRRAHWWLATTVIGWLAGNLAYGAIRAYWLPPLPCILWGCLPYYYTALVSIPPAMALTGIVASILQLPILHCSKKQALCWVVANAGGLYLGAWTTVFVLQLRPSTGHVSDWLTWLFVSPPEPLYLGFRVNAMQLFTIYVTANALVGFIAGIITGGVLVWRFHMDSTDSPVAKPPNPGIQPTRFTRSARSRAADAHR